MLLIKYCRILMKFGEKGGNDHSKNEFKVGRDPDWNPDLISGSMSGVKQNTAVKASIDG